MSEKKESPYMETLWVNSGTEKKDDLAPHT